MARFGRSQPHPPIFLRASLTSLATVAVVTSVHVISQSIDRLDLPSKKLRRGAVVHVRPARNSLVPDRLAPQITVVGQATERARLPVARRPVLLLRGSPNAAPAASGATPRPVVTLQAVATASRLRHAPTPLSVWLIAPPTDGGTVASTPPAVKPVVLSQADQAASRHPARQAHLAKLRNPAVTVPDRLPPQITVVSQATERTRIPLIRRAAITVLRGVGAVFAPKLPAQPLVVSQATERTRQPLHRRAAVIFARNPDKIVAPRKAAPFLVLTQATERMRFPVHRASIFLERNPMEPPAITLRGLLICDLSRAKYRITNATDARYRITNQSEARYRIRLLLRQGGRMLAGDELNPYADLECDFEVFNRATSDGHWQDTTGLSPTVYLAATPTGSALAGTTTVLSARSGNPNDYFGIIDSATLQAALLPTYAGQYVNLVFSISGDDKRRKKLLVGSVGDFDA